MLLLPGDQPPLAFVSARSTSEVLREWAAPSSGRIAVMPGDYYANVDLWVDDEFLLTPGAPNAVASELTQGQVVLGPAVAAGVDDEGSTVDVPAAFAAEWRAVDVCDEAGLRERIASAYRCRSCFDTGVLVSVDGSASCTHEASR